MRSLALLALLPFAATAAPVSLESLLAEMTDRAAPARLPENPYTLKQASSYDRASVSRDTATADGDAKNFRVASSGAHGWFPAKAYF